MCQHMTHDTYAYDVAMAHQSATRVNELPKTFAKRVMEELEKLKWKR